ncbi:hypothetical protein LguiA_004484 [Lonicera macranthoides]
MDFPIGNVVSLDLSYSKLKQVWKGTMLLGPLKILNLSHSLQLARTPDFLGLPNLKKLILKGCVGLVEVCESIGSLEGLVLLNLEDCTNLRKFPNIGNLKFLETLIITGCSNMREFLANLKNEESLKVFEASRFVINHLLPNAVKGFKLKDAFSWPWLSKPRKGVEGFWASLLHSLVNLSLTDCNLSDDYFPADLCNLVSLQSLDLSKNPLRRVPDCINRLRGLKVWASHFPISGGLYEFRIFSTFLPETEAPNWCNELNRGSSISFIVPSYPNLWIRGLNVCVHALSNYKETWFPPPILTGYTILGRSEFQQKMCGFNIVWVDQEEKENIFNTGDNLPSHPVKTGFRILNNHCVQSDLQNCPTAPRWVQELFGDSVEFEATKLGFLLQYLQKISTKTKDLSWIYKPWSFGIPAEDGEELAWLSHWKFRTQLESGDEIIISIVTGASFEVKGCGLTSYGLTRKKRRPVSIRDMI